MPEWLGYGNPLRPLFAGVAYMLLCALGNQVAWYAARWAQGLSGPDAVRLRRWVGWTWLAQGFGLAVALVYPFIMVLDGTFAVADVGVRPIDWPRALPWALAISAGAAGWLALLWGIYGKRASPRAHGSIPAARNMGRLNPLLSATHHEARMAIYRAALAPLAAPYWGAWLALVWKLLAARTDPQLDTKLRAAEGRYRVYLEWSLDWVSATLYIYTRSAALALVARLVCWVAVYAVARRDRPAVGAYCTPPGGVCQASLPDGQSQDDQHHEHAGCENPQALEIP